MVALDSRTRPCLCISDDDANLVYASYGGIVELRIVVDIRACERFSHRCRAQRGGMTYRS